MRYLLQRCFADQLAPRQQFLSDCWRLHFIKSLDKADSAFLELRSIPPNALDICMIHGHNKTVREYLLKAQIPEKILVIVTCEHGIGLEGIAPSDKTIFLAKQPKNGFARFLKGPMYNMPFDPTESELRLYNEAKISKELDIFALLTHCFTRIHN